MISDINAPSRQDRKKARQHRAFLNGVDVSDECYYADEKRGIVRLFKRDESGSFYVDKTGPCGHEYKPIGTGCVCRHCWKRRPATEERRGKVRLERVQ